MDIFENTTDFYLMANINDKNIFNELNEQRKIILNNNYAPNTKFYITLFQFKINQNNTNSFIFHKAL